MRSQMPKRTSAATIPIPNYEPPERTTAMSHGQPYVIQAKDYNPDTQEIYGLTYQHGTTYDRWQSGPLLKPIRSSQLIIVRDTPLPNYDAMNNRKVVINARHKNS